MTPRLPALGLNKVQLSSAFEGSPGQSSRAHFTTPATGNCLAGSASSHGAGRPLPRVHAERETTYWRAVRAGRRRQRRAFSHSALNSPPWERGPAGSCVNVTLLIQRSPERECTRQRHPSMFYTNFQKSGYILPSWPSERCSECIISVSVDKKVMESESLQAPAGKKLSSLATKPVIFGLLVTFPTY